MAKHFYALRRMHKGESCGADELLWFTSKRKRDKFVDYHTNQYDCGSWESLTAREAALQFDVSRFDVPTNEQCYLCDWIGPHEYAEIPFIRRNANYLV